MMAVLSDNGSQIRQIVHGQGGMDRVDKLIGLQRAADDLLERLGTAGNVDSAELRPLQRGGVQGRDGRLTATGYQMHGGIPVRERITDT